MKSKSDPRHNARKLALTAIFCWLFSEPDQEDTIELSRELLDTHNADPELTSQIINGVQKNIKAIDNLIAENAPDWPIDKIAKVDLVILRIALFELKFVAPEERAAVPEKVIIDEAIELAKEFGNDTSSKFVNGVLGTIASEN